MQDSLVPSRSRPPRSRPPRSQPPRAITSTCAVGLIRPFARYLAQRGCDSEAWLRPSGLTMADLDDRDRRMPSVDVTALFESAIALTGDPTIGLKAARCAEPGDFDVMEYAAANCATVGEALQLAARFLALTHDGMTMELDIAPSLAALRVRWMWGSEHAPAGIEFLFASLLAYGSRSVGHPTRPLRVDFTHAGPPPGSDLRAYEDVFREVRFGCDANAMWINASALALPHCAPDRSLLQILTTHADDLLRQLATRPTGVVERVRGAITEALLAGHSGADEVARRLAVSLRTLHRRLAEAGTSHGELLDDVRREQALVHLTNQRFSIGEISFLLGFAHPNGFHKAFKRWMRMTPVQYREAARAPVPR